MRTQVCQNVLFGLLFCGLMLSANEGHATTCSLLRDVKWVSVLEQDKPSAGGHIWILHGEIARFEVEVDGKALALVERGARHTVFASPSDSPATHALEVRSYDEDDHLLEQLVGTYTTSNRTEKPDVTLRKWREIEVFDQPDICKEIIAPQICASVGVPTLREAVVAGESPFGYLLEFKTEDGWEVNPFMWPGECTPMVSERAFQDGGDVRLIAIDSRGKQYRTPDRTSLLGDGGCAISIPFSPSSPLRWLLVSCVVGLGLNRRKQMPM